MKPDISIVIPAYNAERWIRTCIDSCLAQSGLKGEIIVVNDGSTDGTKDILREYGDRIRVIEQENGGAGRARNVGVRESVGDYIKFLDADDYLFPGCLMAQLEHAQSLDPRTISYGRVYYHDQITGRIYPHGKRDDCVEVNDGIGELMFRDPHHCAMLWPRQAYDEVGGYDENIRRRQDFDFIVRATLKGWSYQFCPSPVYVWRDHDSQGRLTQTRTRESYTDFANFFERFIVLLRDYPFPSLRDEIAVGLARNAWGTGRDSLRRGFPEEAERLFAVSRTLAPGRGVSGSVAHRLLVRLFGPTRAERVSEAVKSAVRRR